MFGVGNGVRGRLSDQINVTEAGGTIDMSWPYIRLYVGSWYLGWSWLWVQSHTTSTYMVQSESPDKPIAVWPSFTA